jgi:hypothetical protein
MNPLTIWGTVAKAGDVSAHYRASGAVDSAHSILRDETTLPDDGIQITLCHDDQVVLGELTYAELDDQQTLRAVAVIDGPLTESLAAFPGDLYWSAELFAFGPDVRGRDVSTAERAELVGLSITDSPASTAAHTVPLQILEGDYRDSVARFHWPVSWANDAPLVGRALERRSRDGIARSIAGPEPEIVRVPGAGWLVDGELVASAERHADTDYDDRRPPGRMRYRPCGRILSVR